jgi:hypothetical protein
MKQQALAPVRRRRGRPKKPVDLAINPEIKPLETAVKRPRGRPKQKPAATDFLETAIKRNRGRPRQKPAASDFCISDLYENVGRRFSKFGKFTDQSTQTDLTVEMLADFKVVVTPQT